MLTHRQRVAELAPHDASARAGGTPPLGLIVNPRSFRASLGLAREVAMRATAADAEVVNVESPQALDAALDDLLARGLRRLIVLAGDGTVRGIVERLARLPETAPRPQLLLLPGGRTNLIARDLLPRGDALTTLDRALDRQRRQDWDSAAVQTRRTLRVAHAASTGGRPGPAPAAVLRHGFFLGAALVDGVIRHCHHARERGGAWRRSDAATLATLLALAGRGAAGRSGLTCPLLHIDAQDLGALQGPMRLVLATTLEHRAGLLDPYATRGSGALRITAVARDAQRFWGRLPRLLGGRYSGAMNVATGYLSGRCERLSITSLTGYSLDGEEFDDADPGQPLVATPGPALTFVMP